MFSSQGSLLCRTMEARSASSVFVSLLSFIKKSSVSINRRYDLCVRVCMRALFCAFFCVCSSVCARACWGERVWEWEWKWDGEERGGSSCF